MLSARTKVAFWVALLAAQTIASAQLNSFELVLDKLSKEDASMFQSGLFLPIFMPSNAPPPEVAMQALKNERWFAATNSTAVEVRQFHLRNSYEFNPEDHTGLDPKVVRQIQELDARTNYSAVLFRTPLGERIVVLQFMPPLEDQRDMSGLWWSRVYDPKDLLTPRGRPGVKQLSGDATNRASTAASPDRSPRP